MQYDINKVNEVIQYFTERVNTAKTGGDLQGANGWLDMLLGALSVYEVLIGKEYTVEENRDGTIQVVLYE